MITLSGIDTGWTPGPSDYNNPFSSNAVKEVVLLDGRVIHGGDEIVTITGQRAIVQTMFPDMTWIGVSEPSCLLKLVPNWCLIHPTQWATIVHLVKFLGLHETHPIHS